MPAGALVWLQTQTEDRLEELDPEPVALVVPVEERVDDSQTAVTVTPTWGEPTQVLAPEWFGTVTEVTVAVDSELASQDIVARIGGIDRVAWHSDEAFWRPLSRRDAGDDVAELQTMLTTLGFYEGEIDGEFGRVLEDAVEEWEEAIGVVDPAGRFEPGYVVWIPEPSIEVAAVHLTNGAPAPSAGSVIVESAVPLEEVALTNVEGRMIAPEGQWILAIGDIEVELVDGEVTDDGLLELSTVLSTDAQQNQASGRIRIASPEPSITVPATAVVAAEDGSLCVYVPDGTSFVPRTVTTESGRVATVDIATGLSAGDEVLANPSDVLDVPDCT